MDDRRLARRVRVLELYSAVSTCVLLVLALTAFRRQPGRARFTEMDVERINVVEPDGKLRMVIANRPRSIGPIYKGKEFGYKGGNRPGIIFFNDEGSENGGLGFSGARGTDGTYRASSQLAFDQYDSDQILYLSYTDQNGVRRTGLTVADRAEANIFDLVQARDSLQKLPASPARDSALQALVAPRNGVPLMAQRVFLGRDPAKSAVVNLSDPQGKPRLRLVVDSTGRARVEFLGADGRVTYSLPDSARR
ncbi:hypothetical protein J421_6080 (plasmid) [Gemmatirosa kalamazoonensis]|uniref:Uncharacterized protein n=1 Tax=Gemmatirosa kalamazoonensis TaxID=861299 RepID=W0RTH1_9BACT|nr:hypothetical protein [Gemmatirosa kalamazoonensis]AHG93615.1 hypothetical protein J421_6080 [Gemmatirosa kalamazoonensis]